MRAGRSVTSAVTADSSDMQILAYFDTAKAMQVLCEAAAAALRTGVPLHLRPNQAVFASEDVHLVVDTVAQQIESWERREADAEKLVRRATKMSMDPDNDDEEEAKQYQKEARKHRAEARLAREQLAALRKPAPPQPEREEREFDVVTDVWVKAFGNVANAGQLPRKQVAALRTVMPAWWMEFDAGVWWVCAYIRVNTTDGAAELGPIRGRYGRQGHGMGSVTASIDSPATDAASRRLLRHQLIASKQVNRAAAQTVMTAPFPQLAHVLAHTVCGVPFPPWVGPQWREPAFVAWIAAVYTDPAFVWLGNGKWGRTSPLRQLCADLAAKRGEVTFGEVDAVVGGSMSQRVLGLWRLLGGNIRAWHASVRAIITSGPVKDRSFGPWTCQVCGGHDVIATRIPEVPSDVLCTCGAIVNGGNHGVPAGVVFPDEYQQLRLSASEALEACREQLGGVNSLQPRDLHILVQSELLESGATAEELGAATGAMTRAGYARTSGNFQRLFAAHLIADDGARPARWTYTDAGRKAVDRLKADGKFDRLVAEAEAKVGEYAERTRVRVRKTTVAAEVPPQPSGEAEAG